jgi:hypothetical protein
MHEIDAGRIFWKEWRAQRSFWLGLFGLAIGLEILLIGFSPLRPTNPADLLHLCQSLAIVLACSFATGSAAIAFAGEVEAKTKGLLQRLPVRPRDLLAGKLSLALVGSYALLVALWLAGGLMLAASNAQPLIPGTQAQISSENATFWNTMLVPSLFVAIGSLFSLVLSDVLFTVVIAGVAAAVLSAIPTFRDHVPLQLAVIAVVVLADHFLARRWLRDAGATEWSVVLPRLTAPPLMSRLSRPVIRASILIEQTRSAVAWRRGAGSLIWKEFRQAFPFCLKLLVAGLIALACVPLTNRADWRDHGFISVILILFAPLMPGVAAVRAERRDNAFRLLTHRGVTPDGFWIVKHVVWLSLTSSVFAVLLAVDRALRTGPPRASRLASLWDLAAGAAQETFDSAPSSVIGPLTVAGFHVVLLYALGSLLALLMPGAIMAFFSGAMLWLGLAFCWAVVAVLGIPFWWTIGLLPVVFFAASWVRTGDWLIGRNTLRAWGKVAATLAVPLACMLAATVVFRVTEIPAVAVPATVLESERASGAAWAINAKRSLFVDAINAIRALSGERPTAASKPDQKSVSEGWQYATPAQKAWVAQNAEARRLALEAARHEPGFFPPETAMVQGVLDSRFFQRMWDLAHLLLDSARELESENRLDEALSCYVAVARLGSDASRSGVGPALYGSYAHLALSSMQPWAEHPKQSTGRVKQAIREFERFDPNAPLLSTDVLRSWQVDRRLLHKLIWGHYAADSSLRTVSELWWIRWLFPWELVRLERLVDAVFAATVSEAETVEGELRNQGFVQMTAERIARWDHSPGVPWKYERTTLAPPELIWLPFWREPAQYVDRLASVRMDLLALAIADFAREHRQRPTSLQELVPVYFPRLPIDPWSGREFVYEPQGLPAEINFESQQLPAGTPFLASAGMLDSRIIRLINPGNRKPSVEVVTRLAPPDDSRYQGGKIFAGPMVRLQ